MSVETWTLLPELEFKPGETSELRMLVWRSLELTAVNGLDRYGLPAVTFMGTIASKRWIRDIEFALPARLESRQHCLALLSFHLTRQAGCESTRIERPPWFDEGLAVEHLLPWEVESQRFEARPRCTVQRIWMKLLLDALSIFLTDAPGGSLISIGFDGKGLSVSFGETRLIIPAQGGAWPEGFAIKAHQIAQLPKRLNREVVGISIDKDQLILGNCRYRGAFPKPD